MEPRKYLLNEENNNSEILHVTKCNGENCIWCTIFGWYYNFAWTLNFFNLYGTSYIFSHVQRPCDFEYVQTKLTVIIKMPAYDILRMCHCFFVQKIIHWFHTLSQFCFSEIHIKENVFKRVLTSTNIPHLIYSKLFQLWITWHFIHHIFQNLSSILNKMKYNFIVCSFMPW